MPHVTEEIWSHLPGAARAPDRVGLAVGRTAASTRTRDALERVQEAAVTFRRSGVQVALGSDDERRVFAAVVRPERQKAPGDAGAEIARLQKEIARAEAMLANERFVGSAPPTSSRPSAPSSSASRASSRRSPARRDGAVERAARALATDVAWLAGLSPWPADGFGLERMNALLAALGDPQLRYPAVHVVGTNGKSTATRDDRAAPARRRARRRRHRLAARALVGRADPARRSTRPTSRPRSRASGRRRSRSGRRSSRRSPLPRSPRSPTREVDVAVVEAGLGGRHDATNVLRSPGRPADERRARAHRRARRHGRGDRGGEARCCPY